MMLLIALAVAANPPQCAGVPIRQMVDQYAALILRQDGAGIAHLFGADGEIDNPGAAPIVGETAIRTLLSSFKGAVVKSEALTVADVAAADGDAWRVTGRFHQTGTTPDAKAYDVAGSFDSVWTCSADGWRVRRMATGK
jgi:ketosteroid isomerase-like protein